MAQFRRRTFIINRAFQFRFSFYVCSWICALSIIYPFLIYELYNWFFRYLAADPRGPQITALEGTRKEIILLLIGMQVFFLLITFLISLFLSHKIAGPIYKLSKFMNDARNGKLRPVYFRKHDHFQELAGEYNRMIESLKDSISAANAHVEHAMATSDAEQLRTELEKASQTLKHLL